MFETQRRLAAWIIVGLAFLLLIGWIASHSQLSESSLKSMRENYKQRHNVDANSIRK